MLTPHELATLMLVGHGPHTRSDTNSDTRQIDPVDLDALVSRDLVQLETPHGGRPRPRITALGRMMLQAVARRY